MKKLTLLLSSLILAIVYFTSVQAQPLDTRTCSASISSTNNKVVTCLFTFKAHGNINIAVTNPKDILRPGATWSCTLDSANLNESVHYYNGTVFSNVSTTDSKNFVFTLQQPDGTIKSGASLFTIYALTDGGRFDKDKTVHLNCTHS